MSNRSRDMAKNLIVFPFLVGDFLYMTHVYITKKEKKIEFLTISPELLNIQGSAIPHFNHQKILV